MDTRSRRTPLRILEVTQRYPPAVGGVERHVEQLSRELTRLGAKVEVTTTDLQRDAPFARLPAGGADGPVPVRRHRALPWLVAPHGLGIAAPGQLGDLLTAATDVLHVHAFGYPPTWFGRFAGAVRKLPLVVTPHVDEGTGSRVSKRYARTVARATLRGASRVIALTRREAAYLESLGVPRGILRVIPNGIDLAEFQALPPPEPQPALRILFVGRIYPKQKGLDTLVEAFGRMTGGGPAVLRLVGEDWGGQAALQAEARHLGIADRVHFAGPVARARLLLEYAACDLFVLPSRFEPFGIVLLEAMASGKPIVASRTGGIPEVVEDGRSALLVPPGDSGALAAAMEALAEDPARRARMGLAGKERVLRFAWPTLAPRFLELFEEVAEDPKGRTGSWN